MVNRFHRMNLFAFYSIGLVLCLLECARDVQATTPAPASIRLVNGNSSNEGRVEIYFQGRWGTICDDQWTLQNGNVVCRQLGYTEAVRIELAAVRFGPGTGDILLDDVMCDGSESSLAECVNRGWGVHNCVHTEDAGVMCSTERVSSTAHGSVRLVGGPSELEGRLEIHHSGQWGTVCDDGWSMDNSNVVCRQLGFLGALNQVTSVNQYGEGIGPIFLDNVVCVGTESTLEACASSGWGIHDCLHSEDVAIACSNAGIRLVGGLNEFEGRVEVLYNGIWGSVCDDGWDLNEASVACRQLGFDKAVGAPTSAFFGESSGPILLDQVECSGTESGLTTCNRNPWGVHNCQHAEDAGVICQREEDTTDSSSGSAIRLVGGSSVFEGRVEVLYEGEWGTICDDGWGIEEGQVVCRQLGYGPAITVEGEAFFGAGTGPVLLDELQCTGTENTLMSCKSLGWKNHDCGHAEDSGVICDFPAARPIPPLHGLRLVGGAVRTEGRVEIFHEGKWGSICDDGWDENEANVVCRQLGYPGAVRVESDSLFGHGSGDVWLDDVICDGTEAALADCNHNGWGIHDCTHREDAGVVCEPSPQTRTSMENVRLVGGSTPQEGRVEIYISGRWGTICAHSWDLMDATVLCHQLGMGNAIRADGGSSFGQGTGDIIIDNVRCVGNEAALQDCPADIGTDAYCDHEQDAGVVCGTAAQSSSVRLVGGFSSNEGRVEVFHDGVWGTICDSGWNIADAQVVCRQMGYTGAMNVQDNAFFGQGGGVVLLGGLECTGDELQVIRCPHPGWYDVPSYCTHARDAGVTCRVTTSDGHLNVRLASLSNVYNTKEGRVEVYHLGSWGTVCGRTFDLNAASVVCRQLGYQGAIATRNFAYYGEGVGRIHLSNIDCTGHESDLGDCQHAEGNVGGCTHADDAGVVCIGPDNSLSFTSFEFIIAAAIFFLLMLMVLALAVICYRCRNNDRPYDNDHRSNNTLRSNDEELERAAIQMRRLRGRQPSIPNTYAAPSFRRSEGSVVAGSLPAGSSANSPYESHLFAAGGAVAPGNFCRDDYETMLDYKKSSLPPEPPPYSSPCSSPIGEPPEYPPPPSPCPRRATPDFNGSSAAENNYGIDDEQSVDIYQDIDDYLVPESSPTTKEKTEHEK
ncbi:scavenger receptor cysteine-rich domain-containing protein DMBT1-like [Amphiura filiformis]|uniref:scavenger receptor cysteine-rich domain-containing protein DMBT1-like n=1 Tax=Amphiura filiformis TaxID=82378 RepID=UPI003B21012F